MREGEPSRTEARRDALAAGLVAVVSGAISLLVVGAGSTAQREVTGTAPDARRPRVLLLGTDREVVRTWAASGLRGRTVVHAGRFLHYIDDEIVELTAGVLTRPGTGRALDESLDARASPRNYLAVASATGVARRIFYVSPPRALDQRLASLGMTREALPLRIDAGPAPRVLDGTFPSLEEPVLLDIDASWFDESDGDALLRALSSRGLKIELATLPLAEDADDVSPSARQALQAFAPLLAERVRDVWP
jgi:hypothetical protein